MSDLNSREQSEPMPEHEAAGAEKAVNPVLARLIEEVRNEGTKDGAKYDRVHNRHNR